jgi:chaperonin GroEL
MKLENVSLQMLGRVKKAIVKKDDTTLVEGAGNKKAVQERASLLRRQIDEATSDYDREKLQERLAKLVGGVAVIRVGAATEVEMKEKKDRVDDAQHATKAAVEEGVVPGGGSALVAAIPAVEKLILTLEGDQKIGAQIVIRALSSPLRQIAENAGLEGVIVLQKVLGLPQGHGFNALSDEYVDMISTGIIDPKKVTRLALESAASIASILLTTEAIVAELPKEEEAAPAGGGHHHGDF